VRINLFIPRCFWTTFTTILHLLSAVRSDVRNFYYIGAHLLSPGPKLLQYNFFQIPQLSILSGANNFSADFSGLLAIFDRNFAKIVAPLSGECENYVAYLKAKSIVKKRL